MWVQCRCGRQHFGPYGAAGLVLRNAAGLVLMTHRSEMVHFGGTWSFPGGALEFGETAAQAALREIDEELGVPAGAVEVGTIVVGMDHEDWRYTYVHGTVRPEWTELTFRLNWEAVDVSWVTPAAMVALPLHPDLRTDLPLLFPTLGADAVP
jgi:mutator protein MutT